MDELRKVDLFENIRQHLMASAPALEDPLRFLSDDAGTATAEREREILLAVLMKIPIVGPANRRRLRGNLSALESSPEAAAAQGLTPQQIKRLSAGLEQLQRIQSSFESARGWASGFGTPHEMIGALRQEIPALRGMERWRFLRSVGAPAIIPDRRRRTLLTRLGLIPPPSDYDEGRDEWGEHHDACLTIASLVAEPVATVDLVLGAFAGGEPGITGEAAVCTRVPECDRCPVSSLCDFFRHRRDDLPSQSKTMRSIPEADRPREKLTTQGAETLTDTELLAIILRSGTGGGVTALDLAGKIIERFGSLASLAKSGVGELCEVPGVGPAKATEILAAIQIGQRAMADTPLRGEQWSSSEDIHRAVAPKMATLEHEEFRMLLLDTRLRLIREVTVSRGDLTGATVHPREVFKQAIKESAAGIIAIHNHPSGDPTPSFEDREITNQLVAAGEIVGIRVLDHLVIGAEGYVSFADEGWLQ